MTSRPRPLSEVLLAVGQQVGQTLSGLGNIYMQRQASQGQGIKQQVGAQVQQAESYLADPNYKWDDNKRTAMENFVSKGYEFLAMDDATVPSAYQQFMDQTKGGALLPQTAVHLGSAGRAMKPQTTLTPYDGGITGLLGDTGQGVSQQTQARAEKEKDLDLARQMSLNGQTQAFTTQRDAILQKYGMSMSELESELGMKATQVQLDAQGSSSAASSINSVLTGLLSTDDPQNKKTAETILKDAQNAGLTSWDLASVNATYESLGSGTASLNYTDRLAESGLSKQALALGDIQITQGNQQIKLGDLMYGNEEYLQKRRHVEDGLSDATQFETIFAEAVANGDDKEIDGYMSILEGGGAVSPDLYQAMTNAGLTVERLQEVYGDALSSDAFRAKKNELDMTEMDLAKNQLFRADTLNEVELRSAQLAYGDQVAHMMTPAEIDEALADPRSSLSMLTGAGILTKSDIGSMRTRAGSYAIVRRQEQNAPRIEQKLKLLEMLAAVPANEEAAANSLQSALGELVGYGMLQEDQVAGLVSGFRNQWTTGKATQDAELAATLSNTAYQSVLMNVQKNELMGAAAEGNVASLSDQWDMYTEAFDQQLSVLKAKADSVGCGGDGISMSEADKESCKNISAEIGRLGQQQKEATVELVGTLGPDGEATFMQQTIAKIQAKVMVNPKFANASHVDIARAVNNGLQRQGLPMLGPAAMEDAEARDAAEKPTPEGGAQPAANTAPSRSPLQRVAAGVSGVTGLTKIAQANDQGAALFNQLFSRPQPTTAQQLSASGASASSGGSVAGGSTVQPQSTPTPSGNSAPAQARGSNIHAQRAAAMKPAPAASAQGVTLNLRDNPAFRELTQTVSKYGALRGRELDGREGKTQDELLSRLSRETGKTRRELLDLAQLETTASPSNPVAAPLYRMLAASRGQ